MPNPPVFPVLPGTLGQGSAPSQTTLPAILRGKTRLGWQAVNLGAVDHVVLAANASLGAGLTGSVRSAMAILPQYCKILKVAVGYASVDLFNGTETFNIVVESAGDYNSAAAANSDAQLISGTPNGAGSGPQASYTAGAAQTIAPPSTEGQYGYATAFAAVGACLFAKDVPFSSTTFTNGAAGTGGGSQVLAPTNWDGCYAAGTMLSLRAVTTASTGSVTGLCITLLVQTLDKLVSNDRPTPLLAW